MLSFGLIEKKSLIWATIFYGYVAGQLDTKNTCIPFSARGGRKPGRFCPLMMSFFITSIGDITFSFCYIISDPILKIQSSFRPLLSQMPGRYEKNQNKWPKTGKTIPVFVSRIKYM
jgi:hypothetical protein